MFNQNRFIDVMCSCHVGVMYELLSDSIKSFLKNSGYVITPTKEILELAELARKAQENPSYGDPKVHISKVLEKLELTNSMTGEHARFGEIFNDNAKRKMGFTIKGEGSVHKINIERIQCGADEPRCVFLMNAQSMDANGLIVTNYSGLDPVKYHVPPEVADIDSGLLASKGDIVSRYYNPTSLEYCGLKRDADGNLSEIPEINSLILPDADIEKGEVEVLTNEGGPESQLQAVFSGHVMNYVKNMERNSAGKTM